MNKKIKEQLKGTFLNIQFFITAIVAVVSFCLYIHFKLDDFLNLFLLCFFLIIIDIVQFFRRIKKRRYVSNVNVRNVKENNIKFEPYTVDINDFIEECKTGLMYSLVRINNSIYEIEVQINSIHSPLCEQLFICYINDIKIIGLDNFLNYKFDNVHSFNDLENIEFLEYDNSAPKEYFINKTLPSRNSKLGITREERKVVYPLILVTPIILTVVFILNSISGEEGGILKWGILGIIWIVAIVLIVRAEIEIKNMDKDPKNLL